MNKYFVKIGYSCRTYGYLTGYVYANNQEDAEEQIYDRDNIREADYESNDSDDFNHYEDEAEVDLETENVNPPPNYTTSPESNSPFTALPLYFLAELNSL